MMQRGGLETFLTSVLGSKRRNSKVTLFDADKDRVPLMRYPAPYNASLISYPCSTYIPYLVPHAPVVQYAAKMTDWRIPAK